MKVVQVNHAPPPAAELAFSQARIEAPCGVYVTLIDRGDRLDIRVDPINRDWISRLDVRLISAHESQVAVEVAGEVIPYE